MGFAALFFRVILSAIFASAGLAKFADLGRSRKAVSDFGLPNWAAEPLGLLLPISELLVAVLLIPFATVLWGAIASVLLLVAFIVGIAINLALGRKPECNCFGQVRSEPIGWSTLVRNAVLLAAASFVLWDGDTRVPISIVHALAGFSPLALALAAAAVVACAFVSATAWLAFHLLRQNGRLLLRMDALEDQLNGREPALKTPQPHVGPPIGSPAPYFELPHFEDGAKVTLHTLTAAKKTVALIFSDPGCGPCSELLPQIVRWEREYAETLTIALISRGKPEVHKEKIAANSLRYVLLQRDREVAAKFQANGTPAAILIAADGSVASGIALGAPAIIALINHASKPKAIIPAAGGIINTKALPAHPAQQPPDHLPIGTLAPLIELPNLQGDIVNLSKLKRRDTLILFWNPTCGFCARMLPDLKNWEANRSEDAPQLLVVSTGSVQSNHAMGLQSLVLLDQNFAAGRAFHVRGTPSAVLVDGEGRIASGVMVGAPVILKSLENNLPHPALR